MIKEYTNIQIGNVQNSKNTIYNVDNYVCACLLSFCCSELCSVDQTATVQRESVLDVRVQSDFSSLFALSGRVQFLESGEGCTNDSLSSPDYTTESSEVRFGS